MSRFAALPHVRVRNAADRATTAEASTGPDPSIGPGTTIAVGVRSGRAGGTGVRLARGSAGLARLHEIDLAALSERDQPATRAGETTTVPRTSGPRVVLVGVGDGTPGDLRTAAATLVRSVRSDRLVTSLGAGATPAVVEAVAEGLLLGAYRVHRDGLKAADGPAGPRPGTIDLFGAYDVEAVRRAEIAARATVLARDLSNTRSNVKGPAWLAGQARSIARSSGLGAGSGPRPTSGRRGSGPCSPSAGERREGRGWSSWTTGRAEAGRAGAGPSGGTPSGHVVLVGKGITFDTGGISLKPREAMLGMTTDMTGAAVVLAVLRACAELDLPVRVTGLMAIAENAFGAGSYRPGDIVRTYDGTTVEIRNTDAEGRLVLADAMGYARLRLQPDVLVDVATLTGAATMGLGRGHAPMYTTSPALGRALERAGAASGERLWEMPLVQDYRELIDSDIADIGQISTRPAVGAGSIMAALFLREFAGDVPWAHLDIAGTGRSDRDRGEVSRGGTGFGARLLLRWLQSL